MIKYIEIVLLSISVLMFFSPYAMIMGLLVTMSYFCIEIVRGGEMGKKVSYKAMTASEPLQTYFEEGEKDVDGIRGRELSSQEKTE